MAKKVKKIKLTAVQRIHRRAVRKRDNLYTKLNNLAAEYHTEEKIIREQIREQSEIAKALTGKK